MQQIAISWHIFDLLRGSTYTVTLFNWEIPLDAGALGLGSLGLARVIPVMLFALWGGILADSRDRRQLLIIVKIAAVLFSGTLAFLTLTGRVAIWHIYLLSAAGAATSAFDEPSRQSIVPNIVPPAHMTNAVSLNTLLWYLATIIGPGWRVCWWGSLMSGWCMRLMRCRFWR
jgi:MFS family permease